MWILFIWPIGLNWYARVSLVYIVEDSNAIFVVFAGLIVWLPKNAILEDISIKKLGSHSNKFTFTF